MSPRSLGNYRSGAIGYCIQPKRPQLASLDLILLGAEREVGPHRYLGGAGGRDIHAVHMCGNVHLQSEVIAFPCLVIDGAAGRVAAAIARIDLPV